MTHGGMAATQKQTLGNHQALHVGQFKSDRRGLVSGSIQLHVTESFDTVNFALLNPFNAPSDLVPIPCVGVDRTYDEKNSLGIYTYTYEGITSEPDASLTTFELDITTEEVSIEAHPHLSDVIEPKYGVFDPRLKRFPKYLPQPEGSASGGGLTGGASKKQKTNPLRGTDSYMVFGATFKVRFVSSTIPGYALSGVGTIIDAPIGIAQFRLPQAAQYRKWLKLAPKITKRGNCVEVELNYLMSGRHGIVKEIYGAAQLEEQSDDSSQ